MSAALVGAALVAVPLAGVGTASATGQQTPASRTQAGGARSAFVVTGPGDVAAAVRGVGGTVTATLPLVGGVAASLPTGTQLPGYSLVPDAGMHVTAASAADATATADAPADTARQTMGLDAGSPTGAGVGVAVVDTGVADVPDLAGRVQHINVAPGGDGDGFGHGTFMAGLVGGSGTSSSGTHQGAAPAASIVDVRVAKADGSTSLSLVLRGLQAIAAHQQDLGIRVVNLSLSSNSPLPRQIDPLDRALEQLWARGIVVVVSAGNDGPDPGTIASPADDPMLLTVGAIDEGGTADRSDDAIADFSSRGDAGATGTDAKPDVVAPGAHVVSLRAPGSVVDTQNPQARVDDAYFRGSGTSMSAALVSGAVADLLSARPELTPDQVKAVLAGSAYSADGFADPTAAGSGGVDVAAALTTAVPDDSQLPGDQASWEAFLQAVNSGDVGSIHSAWAALPGTTRAWILHDSGFRWEQARSWAARSWSARSWSARSWSARSWAAAVFDARSWAARSWAARSWAARSWAARSWAGAGWDARSWSARSWAARSWSARSWSARSWSEQAWDAGAWNDESWS